MFFFIGSSRSGSTWLAQALGKHPQIKMPVKKPVRFWNVKVFGISDPKSSHPTLTLEEYKELFQPEPEFLKGDMTDGYNTLGIQEVKAINTHCPKAKIVQMLRRPTDIVHSHFSLHRSMDKLTIQDVKAQLCNAGGYQYHNLRQIQSYELWARVFGAENIHLMFYEDFFADAQSSFDTLCRFLEIPEVDLDAEFLERRVNKRVYDSVPSDEVRDMIGRICLGLDSEYEDFRSDRQSNITS